MDGRVIRAVQEDGLGAHIKDIFISCYDQIIAGDVRTVSELMDYLSDLGWHEKLEVVVRKSFRLIRALHWGVFKDLEKDSYPRLWKTLVIPNRRLRDVGDLKKNLQVPNTFCALMDIHSYTEFCQKHRHNYSMLNVLDDIIQQDIREVAHKNQCLSFRSAGDNILLIGSSAGDVIRTCLGIVDSFSRRRVIKNTRLAETRKGKSIVLQDIHVSAGIAGGQNYSSLVVTRDGDVSGAIVNTAARLQGFASYISPGASRVVVTSHVHSSLLREMRAARKKVDNGFDFFACGKVHFKGIGLTVYEVLATEDDLRKESYQKHYRQLLSTIHQGTWKERLIPDVISLVIAVLRTVPVTKLEAVIDDEKKVYNTTTMIGLAEHALETYRDQRDHRRMNEQLQQLLTVVELVHGFDRLVLDYLRQAAALFDNMVCEYESVQYLKIQENQDGLFSQKERKVLSDADRLVAAKNHLIERGKAENNIYSASMIWNKVVSEHENSWEFQIYSGKR